MMRRFTLPSAPETELGPVKSWVQAVSIVTYEPWVPDKNPMFLEERVYQGSSGRIYPLAFIDRVSTEAIERDWQAVHLENKFIRVMILPEIGGRIHVGLDKINDYDFFYRQNVIKPALVGLAGPWISGGVEFNWPQHHRPATFLPVDYAIEECPDGSRTVWCSDHDPINRLKGMHGICLHPDRADIELKVRLYNRTPFVQTFLWWANVAVHVNEQYQSFFPPDVHYVADHAKRALSAFPLCNGTYYGVDYGSRAETGVPARETPRQFVPPGIYAPNDLSWYANIPVPTSYMAVGSRKDFCGGYDHSRQAGLVQVANHHIAPGKKQWTWGNHDFGYAWDRNLTDGDGPYIELMAGVYTDNQPDFSFLGPGETKSFSQFWYPIREIGPAHEANSDAALSFSVHARHARIGLHTTRCFPGATIALRHGEQTMAEWTRDLDPASPFLAEAEFPCDAEPHTFTVEAAWKGRTLIRYSPPEPKPEALLGPATAPPLPQRLRTTDELYLTGLHLEQYRHATRQPEVYWREALRIDPGDSRCNNALGRWHLRRGEFRAAEQYFRESIRRITHRNANPSDGEPYYYLGLTLCYLGRNEDAYSALYKATWNFEWRAPAYFALAQLDIRGNALETALDHLQSCLRLNRDHLNARNLSVVVQRKLGRTAEADDLLRETLALDPLDYWALRLANRPLGNNQACFDVVLDHLQSGLDTEALEILKDADHGALDGSVPMLLYTQAYIAWSLGSGAEAERWAREAAQAVPDYCFPSRLEEMLILEVALERNAGDSRAHYYLGNFLYDRRRHQEAIEQWELSAALDSSFSIVWRNLGMAYYNVLGDKGRARAAFECAVKADSADARLLYERDQLWKRIGVPLAERLAELKKAPGLVNLRDDFSVELANLYTQLGQPEESAALLSARKFQPWEGGEHMVLGQYVRTQLALGRKALLHGNAAQAISLFESALHPPQNLGEDWHLLANRSNVFYWLGVACEANANRRGAREWWLQAMESAGDFQEMSLRPFSEMTYYQALALERLGREAEATLLRRSLLKYARQLAREEPGIDYFATSLPAMLLFNDDLKQRNRITAMFLEAQAALGLKFQRRGRRLLKAILDLEPSHAFAADLFSELEAELRDSLPVTS